MPIFFAVENKDIGSVIRKYFKALIVEVVSLQTCVKTIMVRFLNLHLGYI